MGLLDWVRGGRRTEAPGPADSVEERVEARREEAATTSEVGPEAVERPLDNDDEEAGRHSGL